MDAQVDPVKGFPSEDSRQGIPHGGYLTEDSLQAQGISTDGQRGSGGLGGRSSKRRSSRRISIGDLHKGSGNPNERFLWKVRGYHEEILSERRGGAVAVHGRAGECTAKSGLYPLYTHACIREEKVIDGRAEHSLFFAYLNGSMVIRSDEE